MTKKKLYKIGFAAQILELETSVLRFWETEFPQLQPIRTKSGQRLYTEKDLILLREIQKLLYEQGMTIDGAKRILEKKIDPARNIKQTQPDQDRQMLLEVQQELLSMQQRLRNARL